MEPIRSSETSDIKTQTPGNYPKRNILHEDVVQQYTENAFLDCYYKSGYADLAHCYATCTLLILW